MFKKHKQLIIGFLLGALVFGIVPVGATVQDYLLKKSETKLMVNGKEFANKELPVLNYQGYNYIPAATFREICDTIGVGFEWVGVVNEIQISTKKSAIVQPDKVDSSTEERKGESMVNIEKDGYKLLVVDGVEYIGLKDMVNRYKGFDFKLDSTSDKINLIYNPDKFGNQDKEEILLKNIPYKVFEGATYAEYNFVKTNIFPLIRN